MKKNAPLSLTLSSVLIFALMSLSSAALADNEQEKKMADPNIKQYRVVYSKNSPLKDLSLNNTEIKVNLYSNGIPKGHQAFKTNEQGEFEFKAPKHVHQQSLSMSLVKLQDDAKKNEVCEGYLKHKNNELQVTCQKKQLRKKQF